MKHTPTPWANRFETVYDANGEKLLRADSGTNADVDWGNANRIVACVNALEGVANPAAIAELVAASQLATEVLANGESAPWGAAEARLKAALAALGKEVCK